MCSNQLPWPHLIETCGRRSREFPEIAPVAALNKDDNLKHL